MAWARNLCWLLLGLLLVGWGEPLSKEAIRSVDWEIDYAKAQADPQRYLGKTLLLGGRILGHATQDGGSLLEILCYRLDKNDKPDEADASCGSFLVQTSVPLDAGTYRDGRLLTLTGTLIGSSEGKTGQRLLFRPGELYLWPLYEERWPPYRYDPFCDPWYPYGRHYYGYPYRCW